MNIGLKCSWLLFSLTQSGNTAHYSTSLLAFDHKDTQTHVDRLFVAHVYVCLVSFVSLPRGISPSGIVWTLSSVANIQVNVFSSSSVALSPLHAASVYRFCCKGQAHCFTSESESICHIMRYWDSEVEIWLWDGLERIDLFGIDTSPCGWRCFVCQLEGYIG